jgi:hypothetical protein
MAFQLLIANVLTFAVCILLDSGSKNPLRFGFDLTIKRLSQSELDKLVEQPEDAKPFSARDFLLDHCTDWSGQALVAGPDGKPAEYSRDALAAMLELPGVAQQILDQYVLARYVSDGKDARAKN